MTGDADGENIYISVASSLAPGILQKIAAQDVTCLLDGVFSLVSTADHTNQQPLVTQRPDLEGDNLVLNLGDGEDVYHGNAGQAYKDFEGYFSTIWIQKAGASGMVVLPI